MEPLLKIEVKNTIRDLGLCQEVEGNPDECWRCHARDRKEGCMNALHNDAAALIQRLADKLEKGPKSQTPGNLEAILSAVCDTVCKYRHDSDQEELEAHCMMCPLVQIG